MNFIKNSKIWFGISTITILVAVVSAFYFGIKLSIDYTGGTLFEVSYNSEIQTEEQITSQINNIISDSNLSIRKTDNNGYIIRLKPIDQETQTQIKESFVSNGGRVERISSIGPTLGKELQTRAIYAVLAVSILIVIYIAFVFRKVSEPVSSWKYGWVALIALLHDVIITIGAFAIFGHFFGLEVGTMFITAILVVLGYSINDTIVVLDRVRENLSLKSKTPRGQDFEDLVEFSLKESLARSINTTLTTVISLVALLLFAGPVVYEFSLALIIGIIAGAYSSIFLAAPLIVLFEKKNKI